MSYYKLLAILWVGFLTTACGESTSPEAQSGRTYADIVKSGELKIATRNAPTTWYINNDGEAAGFEHDLAQAYSQSLDLKAKFVVKDSIQDIFDALNSGEADVAAAGLTVLPSRKSRFLVGPQYDSVHQALVCHRDGTRPESYDALTDLEISVVANSSYVERLNQIQQQYNSQLQWQETEQHSTEALLGQVADKKIDCTVADSNIVKINRRYFPEIIVAMQLTDPQSLALYLPPQMDELKTKLDQWYSVFKHTPAMNKIEDRNYGYFREFDYVDVSVFKRRIDKRLPQFDQYFKVAADRYELPLNTLLAQSYQESHWDPQAVSPTGVKGIMMLTLNTAEAMDISDRTDAKQSIMGGAKYLNKMLGRFKEEVTAEDRLFLALAAYNIGRAHLHDAQALARELGYSPHHWHDMKQVLPLLAQKKYYKDLKYGYARGTEPVRYVQRIREYQSILQKALN
jgi:membrane-bound lytic murein transglycosylase F